MDQWVKSLLSKRGDLGLDRQPLREVWKKTYTCFPGVGEWASGSRGFVVWPKGQAPGSLRS